MFTKLNITHTLIKKPYLDLIRDYHGPINGVDSRLAQYNIDEETKVKMLDIIPVPYREYFNPQCIEVTGRGALPHSHTVDKLAINFYIEPADGTTVGYKQIKGQANAYDNTATIYEFENLQEVDSFLPKAGEIWIINTRQPHAVLMPKTGCRFMYSLESTLINYKIAKYILKDLIDA